MVIMIIGGKFCTSRVQFSQTLKLCQQSTAGASASHNVAFLVRFASPSFESFKSKNTKLKNLSSRNISADLANLVECDQTAEASEPKGTAGLSAALIFFSGSKRSSLHIVPALFGWSDDSRWARGGRVWVGWGRKVPEEPLAFTLAPLVQVVLLVALLACSLVVVVLFQVPHRWPAVLLKVLLVLCIRIICLRDGKGCNVFQDKPWQILHFTISTLCFNGIVELTSAFRLYGWVKKQKRKPILCTQLWLWEIERQSSTFRVLVIMYL